MSFLSKIKKILSILILTASVGSFFSTTLPTAYASNEGDVGKFIGDLFKTGEQGISFTQYQGELAELSTEGYDAALTSSTDFRQFIIKIVNFALGFLGLIAVIIIIYGGVLYVTAAGEDEKTQTGKKAITYAVIGLLIVLGSFAFVNTIIKGATDGKDTAGTTVGGGKGTLSAGGFNASAEQVRALALEIVNGFDFLESSTEELKNIKNDAEKDSLVADRLPPKADILTFLFSVQSKLSNMKAKLQPFSISEARINEVLRDVDKDIDTISSLGTKRFMKINGSTIEYCDPEVIRDLGEGLTGDSDQEVCAGDGYKFDYIEGLHETWSETRQKYLGQQVGTTSNLYALITPISGDYANILERIFVKLDETYSNFANIEAIKQGAAAQAYQVMIGSTAYGYNIQNGKVTAGSEGFLNDITKWALDISVDTVGQKMITGLQQQSILYDALKKLEFVRATLSADTIEGSAPLTVLFDALGTADPAGGSIQGSNITWDLAGTKKTTELISAEPGVTLLPPDSDGSISCEFPTPPGKTEKDFIGETAKRCVFHRPGTYTAAVKINSNEPTKYAPGISILTIKVHPPTTKIELGLTAGSQTHTIMHYDDDILVTDRRLITVTANDAKSGIRLNAAKTNAEKFKWDFGDGTLQEYSQSSEAKHQYKQAGTYQVTLEVVNSLGVVDRKIFTLKISPIAAIVTVTPQSGSFVNNPVTFDASPSKSDLGKIVSYEWTIEPTANQNIPSEIQQQISKTYPFTDAGSNLKTLTHEFKYPIKYNIKVEITDDGGNKDNASVLNYRIESQPPVALFDFQIPESSQPGTVHFNGGLSYDPDGTNNFKYSWTIDPPGNWEILKPDKNGLKSASPIIKFKQKGDYTITLDTVDKIAEGEKNQIKKNIKIDNVLDIAWDPAQQATGILNKDSTSELTFRLKSDNGVAFDIDYGDSQSDNGQINKTASIKHLYKEAGKYPVKVTVYDAEDNDNTISRNFFIADGENPLAKIGLQVDGEEIFDLGKTIRVNRKDILSFDAGDSKNTDGTGRNLVYGWDFGDTQNSTKKKATHSYKELSPLSTGYYKVKLKVSDKDDPTKTAEDEILIDVRNEPPLFSSVQATVQPQKGELITPVVVNMKAYGVKDPDSEIVKYKWWYFDVDDPDEQLGTQVTQNSSAQLVIGTRGKENQKVTYGFGLEITDSDDLIYSNQEQIEEKQYSKIVVTNGKNDLPKAKFNVDTTAVFVGDKVTFISASTDSDGKITKYIWDLEGDGFYNNEPTKESSIEHVYKQRKVEGYEVRLKVRDDKGGEAVSEAIKVYVDSLAKAPKAAFKFKVIEGTKGMKIKFENKTQPDIEAGAKIISYKWDFDTASGLETMDSDGDGVFDNDLDSKEEHPEFIYKQKGSYIVKLTVTDDQGNTDDLLTTIVIPMANPPKAAFTYEVSKAEVVFKNNSAADTKGGADLKTYIWDFDTSSALKTADSDGDGDKTNDQDSTEKQPRHKYRQSGTYQVKLTVFDDQGNNDEVTHPVDFSVAGSVLPLSIITPTQAATTSAATTSNTSPNSTSNTSGANANTSGSVTNNSNSGSVTAPSTTSSPASPAPSTGSATGSQTSQTTSGSANTGTASLGSAIFGTATNPGVTTNGNNTTGGAAINAGSLQAVLNTEPLPSSDGIVYLLGEAGTVKFIFSQSLGKIAYFIIDKNIYFDSNGNGLKDDDEDFKTTLPGSWTTNFQKTWGKIGVKLTVQDINANKNSKAIEIKFK